jgi:hypothetical protein
MLATLSGWCVHACCITAHTAQLKFETKLLRNAGIILERLHDLIALADL